MSLGKFETVTLADVSINNKGEYGIGASAVDYSDELYTYLRITDINDDGTLNKNDLKSVEDGDAKNYLLNENDVVFARTGNSTGKAYYYDKMDGELVYAGFLIKFSLDPSKINPKFMKYYVLSEEYKGWVNSMCTGSTRPNINAKMYGNMELILPPREQQDFLVNILDKIDKKIEINKRINKNLAQIILSNFRRWFVNFEHFKDKPFIDSDFGFIPENWKVGSIGDYCKLKSGFAFKSAWWQDEGIKVIKIKDINQDSLDLSDCSCVSSDKLQKAADFKVVGGDLLIAMTGATIGKFTIVPKYDEPLYVNQRVGKFFLGEKPLNNLPFIWSLLKQKRIFDEIINRGQGSAQPNVSPTDIETIKIILPPIEIINQFNNECKSMFNLIINNSYEITKLNKLRDTLLPKLMSGEIDVSKINCDLKILIKLFIISFSNYLMEVNI